MPTFTAVDFFPLHPGDDLEFEDGGQKVKTEERFYSEQLAARIDGAKTEAKCKYGSIDVLTPDEVIEVKRINDWKSALGQVIAYGFAYPKRKKRIHLLVPATLDFKYAQGFLEIIAEVCKSVGVSVSAEREIDEAVIVKTVLCRVGEETFTDVEQIQARINKIKDAFGPDEPMDQQAEQFILDLVNAAKWVHKRFGAPVTQARIVGKKTKGPTSNQTLYFQVKNDDIPWTSVSIKNYIAEAERQAEVNYYPSYQKSN